MKSRKKNEEKYTPEEIAVSFIFPDLATGKERKEKLAAFQAYRKQTVSKYTEKDKLAFQLLQLKFLIEDYLKTEDYNQSYTFGFFLKEYISRLDKKNKEFAEEIDIDATELSQIINRHRNPSEKIIIRLEIHSNNNFPALLWLRLLEKEKAYELVHNVQLRKDQAKHVKRKLQLSF